MSETRKNNTLSELKQSEILRHNLFDRRAKYYIRIYLSNNNMYQRIIKKRINIKSRFYRFNSKSFTIQNFDNPSIIAGNKYYYDFEYEYGTQLFYQNSGIVDTSSVDLFVYPRVIKTLVTHLKSANFTFVIANIIIGAIIGICIGYFIGNFAPMG